MNCNMCGRAMKNDDYQDIEGNPICGDCYLNITYECVKCGSAEYIDKMGDLIVVFKDNQLKPGIYKILGRPYYWNDIFSAGLVYKNLLFHHELDFEFYDNDDGIKAGLMCSYCQGEYK